MTSGSRDSERQERAVRCVAGVLVSEQPDRFEQCELIAGHSGAHKPRRALDCRSESGVIVGLVDGMIAQARVVARYLAEHDGTVPHEVYEALLDVRADEDVAAVVAR